MANNDKQQMANQGMLTIKRKTTISVACLVFVLYLMGSSALAGPLSGQTLLGMNSYGAMNPGSAVVGPGAEFIVWFFRNR